MCFGVAFGKFGFCACGSVKFDGSQALNLDQI